MSINYPTDITSDFMKTQKTFNFQKTNPCFFPSLTRNLSTLSREKTIEHFFYKTKKDKISIQAKKIVQELLDKNYSKKPKKSRFYFIPRENNIPGHNYSFAILKELLSEENNRNLFSENLQVECFGDKIVQEKAYEKFKKMTENKKFWKLNFSKEKNMDKIDPKITSMMSYSIPIMRFKGPTPISKKKINLVQLHKTLSFDEKMSNVFINLNSTLNKLSRTKRYFVEKKKEILEDY